MPFNMGFSELLIILVIILLLFGAKRIPEIAGSLGKGISSFKKNLSEVEGTFREGVRENPPLDAAPRRDPLPPADISVVRTEDAERPEPKRLLS
jgi:sec-independent protein translocase protein TatA